MQAVVRLTGSLVSAYSPAKMAAALLATPAFKQRSSKSTNPEVFP